MNWVTIKKWNAVVVMVVRFPITVLVGPVFSSSLSGNYFSLGLISAQVL